MIRSIRQIPAGVRAGLILAVPLVGLLIAKGCIAVIERATQSNVTVTDAKAFVSDGWIKVDLNIDRPKECLTQSTQFLRRINATTGRTDIMPISVLNTSVSDSGAGRQGITFWIPVPPRLDLAGGPWTYWNKSQEDCGVLNWILGPPTRENGNVPISITPNDVQRWLPGHSSLAGER